MNLKVSPLKHQLIAAVVLGILIWAGVNLTSPSTALAQPKGDTDPWKPFHFLLGQWESKPDSMGAFGGSTFSLELQNRILMRKNFANYPAANGKPAINHEDLLVLYQQPGNPFEASYWDNEGHVIHYLARMSENEDTLAMTSDVVPNSPRFRLSYIKMGGDSLKVGFEFAPPGNPDAFKPYLTGMLHKK